MQPRRISALSGDAEPVFPLLWGSAYRRWSGRAGVCSSSKRSELSSPGPSPARGHAWCCQETAVTAARPGHTRVKLGGWGQPEGWWCRMWAQTDNGRMSNTTGKDAGVIFEGQYLDPCAWIGGWHLLCERWWWYHRRPNTSTLTPTRLSQERLAPTKDQRAVLALRSPLGCWHAPNYSWAKQQQQQHRPDTGSQQSTAQASCQQQPTVPRRQWRADEFKSAVNGHFVCFVNISPKMIKLLWVPFIFWQKSRLNKCKGRGVICITLKYFVKIKCVFKCCILNLNMNVTGGLSLLWNEWRKYWTRNHLIF